MKELWLSLDVLGYSKYSVSNKGKIRNDAKERILPGYLDSRGRVVGLINNEGKKKNIMIHILVAKLFCLNQENKPNVWHKDKNLDNNRYKNLMWVTKKEIANLRKRASTHKGRNIYQLDKNMIIIKRWDSLKEAGDELNINRFNISTAAKLHKRYKDYFWEYCDNFDQIEREWKQLTPYDGSETIGVSRCGLVRYKNGRITDGTTSGGYRKVSVISLDKTIKKNYAVHRLIAMVFIEGDKNLCVNHLDGEKLNNESKNLELVTIKENNQHATVTGLISKGRYTRKVRQMDLKGNIIEEFDSAAEASRKTNIGADQITVVCKGRRNRKTAGKYTWCYV